MTSDIPQQKNYLLNLTTWNIIKKEGINTTSPLSAILNSLESISCMYHEVYYTSGYFSGLKQNLCYRIH